jgi:DNA polymerase III subunit alpha
MSDTKHNLDQRQGATHATQPPFVHLKVHSAYSLLEGALQIGKIAKLAEAEGYPAVALTDTNNLFGCLEFSDKLAASGIQPIAGVSLAIDFEDKNADKFSVQSGVRVLPHRDGLIGLIAMNSAGYANLMKLVSIAHLATTELDTPHIRWSTLHDHNEGLIVLSGGPDGPIDRQVRDSQLAVAEARLEKLKSSFGDRVYIELQRHKLQSESDVEPQLLTLGYKHGLPLVATNECYFATADEYEAHDALLCIAGGRYVVEDDRRRVTREHYFKPAAVMVALFADLPEAIANTVEIAQRCAFRPRGRMPILPRFVASITDASDADQLAAEAAELAREAEAGLKSRLTTNALASGFDKQAYAERLAFEVDIITRMKFPGYFLIVSDFIRWAKREGIPVGPGRGSGAGSLVAWSLDITDLDPLRFGLLFERFLNPERVSMPDFDIDFCQDRREEVIDYVQQKYGRDRVAQIITHGKLQARAVLRDVGRVMQIPYGQVDRLCKLVPNNPAAPVTLAQAIESEPKLREERDREPLVARLLEISQKLEGLYRHASTHAAGIVIGDRPLDLLVPLYRDPKSTMPVTQFNWKMVEAAGLVKFDFLGLKTLTVLKKAVQLIKRGRGIDVDLATLGIEDPASYALLAKADTAGVFQLESTGMRESLKRLKPDRFEDIIAMVALYRPGPMDNIPTYIHRKHGEEPVDYFHPLLEGILRETYGVIIYQEQVMQIAQVMAGFSLGEADLLRRAMGKKDKVEMAKQQARFVEGSSLNGVSKAQAKEIFELVDKFAGYGFNKSHAAAYALVSYHTAYLKANFREEFLAASMTLDMGNTDKLAMFAAEAKKSGIRILPPCVNASEVDFLAEPPAAARIASSRTKGASGEQHGAIRYSLAALKNIGASAVSSIVQNRTEKGPYQSLGDFASRLNPKALNKRGLETLSCSGAFDSFEPNRALVAANVEGIMALANRVESNTASGTSDLFGSSEGAAPRLDLKPTDAWTPMERLQSEFDAVGFFLSGHPLDQYGKVLAKLGVTRFTDFEAAVLRGSSAGRLAAIVISARERRSQKGNKFAFAMFSDTSGQFEAVIFSEALAASRDLLEGGTPVLLSVEAERDGDTVKLRVQSVEDLNKAAARIESGLMLTVNAEAICQKSASLARLKSQLKPGSDVRNGKGGEVRLVLRLPEHGRELEFILPGSFDVSPSQAGVLSTVPGIAAVTEV